MTTPEDPERNESPDAVDLTKADPAGDPAPFDPYRFGQPEHPIAAEYAPPGYTGPVIPATQPTPGYGTPPPGVNPANPFSNPPGMPYPPAGEQPGGYPPAPPGPYPPPGQYPPYGPPPGQYPQYGPPPGQPPQYGPPGQYPSYGPQHAYGQRPGAGNGKAIAALVLGIGSIVFFWLSFFDALVVIPGLIFALIAMNESKMPGRSGRSMALAGLICTIVGGVLATVFTALLVHAANQCGGLNNTNAPGWDTCVRHNFF